MNEEQAKKLRDPFPADHIGLLPKGGTTLEYVGHGAVTDRLLEVDPDWNWEPLSVDELGFPRLDSAGNLWIRLTVGGVTRLGVGDGATMKVLIGDALRNAAMRFGVALDLWIRGHAEDDEQQSPPPARQRPQAPSNANTTALPNIIGPGPFASPEDHQSIRNLIESLTDAQRPAFLAWWRDQRFPGIKSQDALSEAQASLIFDHFDEVAASPVGAGVPASAAVDAPAPTVDAAGAPVVAKTDEEENLDYFSERGMLSPEEEDKVRTGGSPATARAAMDAAKSKPALGAKR